MKELIILFLFQSVLNFYTGFSQRVENVELECLSNQIKITIRDSFFSGTNISVNEANQLYFNRHPLCHSSRIKGGFTLIQFTPYGSCGTSESHNGNSYVYRNEIVTFSQQENAVTPILLFTCEYKDQYVVSSNLSITPNVRTLNFITSRGTLSVEMNLYQREDYHPKSKYGNRPRIIVGVPIYVSVDLLDVFGNEEIAVTLQSCFATTTPSYDESSQGNVHYFIIGRCVGPDDDTVRIFSNGVGANARFTFLMFQWKNQDEYIYLHCEVQICDKNVERCSNNDVLCNGPEETFSNKRKRDVSDVYTQTGFISMGPIEMVKLDNGKASLQTINNNFTFSIAKVKENSQKLMLTYVLGSIAVVLLIVCSFLYVFVAMKRRERNKKLTSIKSSSSSESMQKPKPLPFLHI